MTVAPVVRNGDGSGGGFRKVASTINSLNRDGIYAAGSLARTFGPHLQCVIAKHLPIGGGMAAALAEFGLVA